MRRHLFFLAVVIAVALVAGLIRSRHIPPPPLKLQELLSYYAPGIKFGARHKAGRFLTYNFLTVRDVMGPDYHLHDSTFQGPDGVRHLRMFMVQKYPPPLAPQVQDVQFDLPDDSIVAHVVRHIESVLGVPRIFHDNCSSGFGQAQSYVWTVGEAIVSIIPSPASDSLRIQATATMSTWGAHTTQFRFAGALIGPCR